MWETVLIITAITLLFAKFAPEFRTLKIGRVYLNREGDAVEIRWIERIGNEDIYIARDGIRYFSNGTRVGDIRNQSRYKLVKSTGSAQLALTTPV